MLLRVDDMAHIPLVSETLQAHAYWRLKGLAVDLVIWTEEYMGRMEEALGDAYSEPVADVRGYVRSVLEPAYRVIEAADGQYGLECAREALPDLVIRTFRLNGLFRAVAEEMARPAPRSSHPGLRDFLEIPYDQLEEMNLEAKEERLARRPADVVREQRMRYLNDEKRINAVTV